MDSPVRWKAPILLTLLFHFILTQGWLSSLGIASDPPGPREAYVLRESLNVDPIFNAELQKLNRSPGPVLDALTKDGDKVVILDPDAKDEQNRPNASVAKLKQELGTVSLPAMIVVNPATKNVTYKGTLRNADGSYLNAEQISKLIE